MRINNIINALKIAEMIMFADDTIRALNKEMDVLYAIINIE